MAVSLPGRITATAVFCLTACLATGLFAQGGPALPRMEAFWDRVRKGSDVQWLEEIASSPVFLYREWSERVGNVGVGKELRADAYVRLAALGTPESFAAISRIDARLRAGRTLPEPSASGWQWESPATWMGGVLITPKSDARIGRREYSVSLLAAYSPLAPHLSWRDAGDDRWSRPRLAGEPIVSSSSALDANLNAAPPDLQISFAWRQFSSGVTLSGDLPPSRTIKIDDVERDTDRDGWTDLEERTLGMSPTRADSDGDGLADDRDVTPMYAPPGGQSGDEDAQVLQRAFIAAYGLTGSRFAIFVRSDLKPLQLYGLSGPVFFGVDLPPRTGCGGRGGRPCAPTRGAEVAWQIMDRSIAGATVVFTTWQGTSFFSRTRVRLQKIRTEWFVVECSLAGIT